MIMGPSGPRFWRVAWTYLRGWMKLEWWTLQQGSVCWRWPASPQPVLACTACWEAGFAECTAMVTRGWRWENCLVCGLRKNKKKKGGKNTHKNKEKKELTETRKEERKQTRETNKQQRRQRRGTDHDRKRNRKRKLTKKEKKKTGKKTMQRQRKETRPSKEKKQRKETDKERERGKN